PSAITVRTRGSLSTSPCSWAKNRGASTTAGPDLATVERRREKRAARPARRDPAAEPDREYRPRIGVSKQRQVTRHELRGHVRARGGIGLSVDAQEDVVALTNHGPRAADSVGGLGGA